MNASESWTLCKSRKQKIDAINMKILRKIARITRLYKIINKIIRNKLKMSSVIEKIEIQQLV